MEKDNFRVLYTKQYREFEKAKYITDKSKRLKRIRQVEAMPKETPHNGSVLVAMNDLENTKSFSTGNEISAYKRILQIDIEIDKIRTSADKIQIDEKKRTFLINEKYKYRKNIFDSPLENQYFEDEYNYYIASKIDEMINKIPTSPDLELSQKPNEDKVKKLIWNEDILFKNFLGTLLGVLHKNKIIKSSQENLAKAVAGIFENISRSSLEDNIKLKKGKHQSILPHQIESLIEEFTQKTYNNEF